MSFFALMRLFSPLAGLAGALVASLLLGLRQWQRREQMKVLELGTLTLFSALVLYTLIAAPEWTVATVRLAVDGGLLAIVLVSLAIDQPFTLQYARERVPQEYWAAPLFIATNRRITAAWAAAFAVMTGADAAAQSQRNPSVDRHRCDHRRVRCGLVVHAVVSRSSTPPR